MVDKNVSEAAWTLFTSFQEANRAVAGHLVSAQERNRKLAERFFMEGMEVLKANQEAFQTLARAPVETTLDVLRTPLAAYQKALGMAETLTRQGLEQMQQAAEQMQQDEQASYASGIRLEQMQQAAEQMQQGHTPDA